MSGFYPKDWLSGPHWPLGYLQTFGPRANPATALTWGLLAISLLVVLIVGALLVAGMVMRRVRAQGMPQAASGPDGLMWLYVGTGLTVVALTASLVWTVAVLARINAPSRRPAFTVIVKGRQWWWQIHYPDEKTGAGFDTANEIHIPVGSPVLVRLESGDVIHSFWVPALTGKTDTIPGRTNLSWLEADRPGTYYGQCTEYCGAQHAHMAMSVIAQPRAEFDAWLHAQSLPAARGEGAGAALFAQHCSRCHTVRGTSAHGQGGPDLTHLMSRRMIAAGLFPNQRETLMGWVANPQALKPDAKMPATGLSGPQLNVLADYLMTLR